MRTILIPLSLRDSTPPLVEHGARLARIFGSTVWLLHIFKASSLLSTSRKPPELEAQKEAELREVHTALDALVETLTAQDIEAQAFLLPGTDPATLIVEQAQALQADLMVLGSHSRSALVGALLGNVTHDVLRHAPCPVLVIPTTPEYTKREGPSS